LSDVPEAFFVLDAVQFHRMEDIAIVKTRIDALGTIPSVVVVDTFARCAVGVNENDATEVGVWLDAVRELQEELHVDVLALHHARRQQGKAQTGERGSTAFIGAVDTAVRLKRTDKVVKVTCEKQKDAEDFESFALHTKVVSLGVNEHGEPMDSCVLVS